jgi:hypothetical protein
MAEDIVPYLKNRLRDAGPRRWEAIAKRCKPPVAASFIQKFVYNARDNPRVNTVQPLLHFFDKIDRGVEKLPEPIDK